MTYTLYMILGLSSGAIIGFIALGTVIGYRSSGVLNLAQGGIGMYVAYVYVDLRTTGQYLLPVIGLPGDIKIGPSSGMSAAPALLISLATAALVGFLLDRLVFRPMRRSPPLAQVVASLGVLLTVESVIEIRFGSNPLTAPTLLPTTSTFKIFGTYIPNDQVILTLALPVVALLLWAVYRFTRLGVATRGAAENPKAAVLLGVSASQLAGLSWIAASLLAGAAGIFSAQITGLTPEVYTLLIIPALAAALAGRLSSVGITAAVALGIGALQSLLTSLPGNLSWWPAGTSDALPFVIIAIVMFAFGRSLPQRGAVVPGRLPFVPRSGRRLVPASVAFIACAVLLYTVPSGYNEAIVNSLIGAILCLSLVVLTGYVGQISLFQITVAGIGAYFLAGLTTYAGVPFPFAPIIAALGASAIGLLSAVPALRVRGVNLAIVTLAFGWAVEQTIFSNPTINGGYEGLHVVAPRLFGINLAFISGAAISRPAFGMLALVLTALCALGVSNLRRSRAGRRMLAVRSDEQAAAAAGINVARTKMVAFAIAGFLAGLSGALTAYQQTIISNSEFDILISLSALAAAYLGGITSVPGAMIGGTLIAGGVSYYLLNQILFTHVANGTAIQDLVAALALILMAIYNPEGIAGAVGLTGRKLREHFGPTVALRVPLRRQRLEPADGLSDVTKS